MRAAQACRTYRSMQDIHMHRILALFSHSRRLIAEGTSMQDTGEVAGIDGGGLVNRIFDALLAEVLWLLEVDDVCSAARNDELGGAGNFRGDGRRAG
jgi:hypothetical protein